MIYDEEHVLVEKRNNIAFVTLARPPVNAFNRPMYDQFRRTIHKIGDDREVHVVLLTGQGHVFCGGNDINDFVDFSFEDANEHLAHARLCFNALYDCPVPVIAAVNGAAVGTGLGLAGLSDVRISAESAFYSLPEINVGVLGGARHTLRYTPQGLTRLMMYTGRRISSAQALAACMVEEVVPDDQLISHATALAEEIASKNPQALRLAKESFNRTEFMSMKEGYEFECTLTAALRKEENIGDIAAGALKNLGKSGK